MKITKVIRWQAASAERVAMAAAASVVAGQMTALVQAFSGIKCEQESRP